MKKFAIIIPARYNSSRFPGKPLALINGKTLIERVYDKCLKTTDKKNIFIATDDKRIGNFLKTKKIKYIYTSRNCLTGTDRVAEASRKIKTKIIINVQGDEPMISHLDIKKIIKAKQAYPDHIICGYNDINNYQQVLNLNVPKIVKNSKNDLIYISRSPIPGSKVKHFNLIKFYRQVCIYAFNKKQLMKFYNLRKKSKVEKYEDIELLRFFELDEKIKVVKLSNNSIAVDVKEDIKKVELEITKLLSTRKR
jgi:3-deoxy-manno-octulosonate cytidylyltransferase (CMP-KDO synthetase)